MYQVPETKDSTCYAKAVARGDETFTLVGQDRSAPRTVAYWILENIETAPEQKLVDALHAALRMRATAKRKTAD